MQNPKRKVCVLMKEGWGGVETTEVTDGGDKEGVSDGGRRMSDG